MEKIYGTKQRQDGIVHIGRSKWILFYGFGKDNESDENGWEYRHTFDHKPTLSEVRELVVSTIDNTTHEKIVNGLVWNGESIYLSIENQLNFAAIERSQSIPFPLTLKINELADGTPVYHTFENTDDYTAFYQAVTMHITETLQNGWEEKDSIDLSFYNMQSE